VFQRTLDYPEERRNGFHVAFDSGKVVTIRYYRMKACNGLGLPRRVRARPLSRIKRRACDYGAWERVKSIWVVVRRIGKEECQDLRHEAVSFG